MKRRFLLIALLLSLCSLSYAGDYYINPATGVDDPASGTQASPFKTPAYALAQKGGGHTYHFAPGIYPPVVNSNTIQIPIGAKGTQAAPTILKSDTPLGAVINGSSAGCHGISSADNCDWVTVDGFEVKNSSADGIKLSGSNTSVLNCWVHGSVHQGIATHGYNNVTVESNNVESNGTSYSYDHGIYIGANGGIGGTGIIIRKNTIRKNSGYGIQLYPDCSSSTIEWNTISDNGRGIVIGGKLPGNNVVRYNSFRQNNGCVTIYSPSNEQIKYNLMDSNAGLNWFDGTASTWGSVVVDYNTWPRAPQFWPGIGLVPGTHNILGN